MEADKQEFSLESGCPQCQGTTKYFFTAHDTNRKITRDAFIYLRCTECGLVFLNNVPEAMTKHYAGGYQPIPSSLVELKRLARKERYRLEPIVKFVSGGRLLELGPWIGLFSYNAKEQGFYVSAIEMNAECVDFMKNRLGICAIQSDDPETTMEQLDKAFDVIAMWHSLEHFRAPWKILAQAARLLEPGGILLIAIPNIESHEFTRLKSRWTHIDAPRHISFFPLGSLKALCEEFGLSCVHETTNDILSHSLRRSSWQAWAASAAAFSPIKRIIGATIGRAVSWIMARKEPGAGITVVFRKEANPKIG